MKTTTRGFFLVVEGADGSGKSTLVRHLAEVYGSRGWNICLVREPGGTPFSERVRRMLLDKASQMHARSELFLYLAARAQVVDDVIRPALARGAMVIADRFSLSTYAYQSGGRGLPLFAVAGADQFARDGLSPDLTLVLSVSVQEAARRRRRAGRPSDRMEAESPRFHEAVHQFYDRWGSRHLGYRLINSEAPLRQVQARAVALVDARLRRLAMTTRRRLRA
ncbi:MAG: dTMP kinase [Candidatus Zixiibacteriota bacterium]